VVSFTPWPLYPQGKSSCYPLDRRLDGTQSHSGRGGEEKNSQSPPGIEPKNPDRPARSLVAIPTELSRLFHMKCYNPNIRKYVLDVTINIHVCWFDFVI
jgi:hypothetical protein